MKCTTFAAVCAAVLSLAVLSPAVASQPSVLITIPLSFGGPQPREPARVATGAEVRSERRARLVRYAFQLADAIVSAIGYRAYERCLSCLAYPGGGPRGGLPVSVATFNGNRPAEVDPLVQPFSRGGFLSLAFGTLAYDLVDARVEKHWTVERRTAADIAEIGAHVWGVSTWLPEIRNMRAETTLAATCGAQWRAHRFGEAFSDGCVNRYFRPGAAVGASPPASDVFAVCAPARFKRGTYLFTTPNEYIIASGAPCAGVGSAPP